MSNSKILNLNYKNLKDRLPFVSKKAVWKWIFGLIFLVLLYVQINHVLVNTNANLYATIDIQWTLFGGFIFIVTAALIPINWCFETLKWTLYMDQKKSFTKHFKAVMAGVTFSMFTPNRIGEFGGRLIILNTKERIHGLTSNLIGSLAQWITLFTCGWIMLIPYLTFHHLISDQLFYWIILIGTIGSTLLLFLYFNIDRCIHFIENTKWGQKIAGTSYWSYKDQTIKSLLGGLGLSFLRYITYGLQYLLLLHFCGIQLDPEILTYSIAVIFLIQTGIPIPPSLGLLARGNVAIFILCLQNNALPQSVLLATGLLWLMNVAIPALAGALVILRK